MLPGILCQQALLEFNSMFSDFLFKQILDFLIILYTITSLIHLTCAIAHAHASTRATSLMRVKKPRATFVYDIYCLGHWN